MKDFNIELFISKWVFNFRFDRAEFSRFAEEALIQGYDGNGLIDLAISTPEDLNVESRFADTLREMGLDVPSRYDAGMVIARHIARSLVDGLYSPDEGAQIIWNEICEEADEESFVHLEEFCVCASNYDDLSGDIAKDFYGEQKRNEMLKELDDRILAAARKICASTNEI